MGSIVGIFAQINGSFGWFDPFVAVCKARLGANGTDNFVCADGFFGASFDDAIENDPEITRLAHLQSVTFTVSDVYPNVNTNTSTRTANVASAHHFS